MSTQTIKFFGSDADLQELRQVLSKAGFKEVHSDTIHATDGVSGDIIPTAITFAVIIAPHFVSCIQTYLKERTKRIVKHTTFFLNTQLLFNAQPPEKYKIKSKQTNKYILFL